MPGFLTLLLALPLSTALFIFSPTMAHAKNRPDPWTETHGGDPTVFEFEDQASQIYVDLSRLDEFKLIPKDFTKKFILNTFRRLNRVSSTSTLLTVDGNTKTALNRVSPEDPPKKRYRHSYCGVDGFGR